MSEYGSDTLGSEKHRDSNIEEGEIKGKGKQKVVRKNEGIKGGMKVLQSKLGTKEVKGQKVVFV